MAMGERDTKKIESDDALSTTWISIYFIPDLEDKRAAGDRRMISS